MTILTLHKPKLLLAEKAYKIERVTDWMYRSFLLPQVDVVILVQREMRGLQLGEAMALLQIIESDKDKQQQVWERVFDQNLDNIEKLQKIVEKIGGEVFMNLVQQLKKQGLSEGKQEIALEMLKDGMGIAQIVKFTKLSEENVLALKKQLEDNH